MLNSAVSETAAHKRLLVKVQPPQPFLVLKPHQTGSSLLKSLFVRLQLPRAPPLLSQRYTTYRAWMPWKPNWPPRIEVRFLSDWERRSINAQN